MSVCSFTFSFTLMRLDIILLSDQTRTKIKINTTVYFENLNMPLGQSTDLFTSYYSLCQVNNNVQNRLS